MNALFETIAGWQGFLSRGGVLLQLLSVPLVLMGLRLLAGRETAATLFRHRSRRRGVGLLLLGGLTTLLALTGQPFSLLGILTGLIGGWYVLEKAPEMLASRLDPHTLEVISVRLLRPLYLVGALMLLVGLLDNPNVLGLIPIGDWAGSKVNLGTLLRSLLVLYVLVMAMEPPTQGLAWVAQRFLGISDGSRRAMAVILHYAVVGGGVLWILDRLGVNRTALLAVAGGLSVGVGFGIKEVVSNFISGLWLLIEGSVRPGDVLILDGDACQVRRLGPRAATLWRDRDNAELLIPNQTFFTSSTVTYTHTDSLRRCEVAVGAAYHHPPAVVIGLLERSSAAVAGVLPDPPPRAFLLNYGDSAVEYVLRFWIASALDNLSISSRVREAIWQTFREEAIEIPYPHQVQLQQAINLESPIPHP
ncbi:MAG: mechanosensitive ion channel domain-containing protein [Cyanobacteriota bacterium]|jgi:potassium-dependent mechanosensitive channel|nr:mechanosensitive ion channel domain-containing protein [Cyanobacteriota bacterium]